MSIAAVKHSALSRQRLQSSCLRWAHLRVSAAAFWAAAWAASCFSCSACAFSAAWCCCSAAWYVSYQACSVALAAALAAALAVVDVRGFVRCLRGWRVSAGALAARLEPAVALLLLVPEPPACLERPLPALCLARRALVSAAACASAAANAGSMRLSCSSNVGSRVSSIPATLIYCWSATVCWYCCGCYCLLVILACFICWERAAV